MNWGMEVLQTSALPLGYAANKAHLYFTCLYKLSLDEQGSCLRLIMAKFRLCLDKGYNKTKSVTF